MAVIQLHNVSKQYALYTNSAARWWEMLDGRPRHQVFHALHPINLHIQKGEVVGVLGMNGAGKSTLLKLIAGTLTPTHGSVKVEGRVASLLELGTGFHPDLSGRDNVHMACAIQGWDAATILEHFDNIVEFAELSTVIDRPLKTYSSGMMMRLAFSVATAVKPDVLIIDEALSVGDARFAHKSFERIMRFCDAGVTVLFCSHSLYQVEAICSRVLWLSQGQLLMDGLVDEVVTRYSEFIDQLNHQQDNEVAPIQALLIEEQGISPPVNAALYRLLSLTFWVNEQEVSQQALLASGVSTLRIAIEFASDPIGEMPTVAVCFTGEEGRILASSGSWNDGVALQRDALGKGRLNITFADFGLLKGRYYLHVYLMDSRGLFPYAEAEHCLQLNVTQHDKEQGRFRLPRQWQVLTEHD